MSMDGARYLLLVLLRVLLRVLLILLLAACGDRTADVAPRVEAQPPVTTLARVGAPPAAIPGALIMPAAFRSACLVGDPLAGTPWSIAQVDRGLAPLMIETIETLPTRDSARLAARVARAVDVLPSDTALADFRGLPVVVRAAWRVAARPGDTIVAALVVRRLPMESNPLEELFFLVAEPGQRQGVREPLIEAWVTREVAPEEMVVVRELLAAFISGEVIMLVVAHESADGVRTELLSRRSGTWRVDWTGPLPTCAP